MSNVEAEIFIGLMIAGGGAIINGWMKRQDDIRRRELERQEEQRKETGKRIGRLERLADFERGRQAGLREARRTNRGRNG